MSQKPRGSTRKKHRNSKLGCTTCKRRRVKCMETLPECTNCVKHGSRCDYLDYTAAQLEEFRKAKQEYYESEAFSRPSVTDPATRQLQGLSLGEFRAPSNEAPLENGNEIGNEEHENEDDSRKSAGSVDQFDGMVGFQDEPHGQLYTGPGSYFDQPFAHEQQQQNQKHDHESSAARDPTSIDYTSGNHVLPSPAHQHSAMSMSNSRWSSLDSVPGVPQSGVTQDFDDLLVEHDHQIIYPVYSFKKSVQSQWSLNSTEVPVSPTENASVSVSSKALPHAVYTSRKFKALHPKDMNFDARLFQCIISLGPLIAQGKADLAQIRELYHVWLGHFIYKAYESSIMFSCLTNLTTNYLITNVFRSCAVRANDRSLRKTLLMHSISHYAYVIKSLRSLLNKNSDPQLASSVSYILSIMSVYDPEATRSSTICFRDGMFSVLSYSLQVAKTNGTQLPIFLPVHLQLASNLMRTVYLPSYDPAFLTEYETMLGRLGVAIGSLRLHPEEIQNRPTFDFIVEVYEDLWKFSQESIKVHIPAANASLDDIPRQLDILFLMFQKWANLGPSRLLTVSRSTDPLEKVLNLYFRLFRKAAYALLPQVKFGFLRDFDSPLMLDVFPSSCDASVLYSLDSPEKQCLAPEAYARILGELKLLAAYAIRVIAFLDLRIKILYKNLVYSEEARRLNPIDNLIEWKDSITDIHVTRKEFQDRIGLQEKCIRTFNDTYITQAHYPRITEKDAEGTGGDAVEGGDITSVDLLSLQPHGLLEKDELPVIT